MLRSLDPENLTDMANPRIFTEFIPMLWSPCVLPRPPTYLLLPASLVEFTSCALCGRLV